MATTPTLTARIALTGGPEIQAQLAALGKAGEAAFAQLKVAAEASGGAGGFGARFSAAIAETKTKLVEFGAVGVELGAKMAEAGRTLNEFGNAFFEVGKRAAEFGLVVIGLEFGLGKLETSAAETAEKVQNLAKAFGLSTDQVQELTRIGGSAGIGQEQLFGFLTRLNKVVEQLGKGGQTVVKTFQNVDGSLVTVTETLPKTAEQLAKVGKSPGDAAKAGVDLGNGLTLTGKAAKDLAQIKIDTTHGLFGEITSFADQLDKVVPNVQERLALLSEIAGKGIAAAQFDTFLSKLAEADKKVGGLTDSFRDLSTAEIGTLVEAQESFRNLGTAVTAVKDHIAAALAPAFEEFAVGVTNFLTQNSAAWVKWASDLSSRVIPIIKDVFNALSGNDAAVQNKGVLQLRDQIVAFGLGATSVVNVLVNAFRGLVGLLDRVASLINSAFGTHFSGAALIAAAAFLQLSGVIGAVALLFSPGGLLLAGIVLLLADIQLLAEAWPKISAAAQEAAGRVNAGFESMKAGIEALAAALAGRVTGGFQSLASGVESLFNAVIGRIQALWDGLVSDIEAGLSKVTGWIDSIKSAIQSAIDAASGLANLVGGALSGDLTSPTAQAAGGYIRGPGTATSDSIPARLSNGEFVMSARAVRHWGVGVMAAINQLRGFSLGGLVDDFNASFAIPGFSGGGLALAGAETGKASGGQVFRHELNLRTNAGNFTVRASDDTVNAIRASALADRMFSTGVRPSWA